MTSTKAGSANQLLDCAYRLCKQQSDTAKSNATNQPGRLVAIGATEADIQGSDKSQTHMRISDLELNSSSKKTASHLKLLARQKQESSSSKKEDTELRYEITSPDVKDIGRPSGVSGHSSAQGPAASS